MKAGCLVLAALALCGCAHQPKAASAKPTYRVHEIIAPDGQPGIVFTCGNFANCYKGAGEQCPNGYDTFDQTRGGWHKSLVVRCH